MIDLPFLVKDLIGCKFNLQLWLNNRYRREGWTQIKLSSIRQFLTADGFTFKFNPVLFFISDQIHEEYKFDDIKKDDKVIDLGANVGYFCIRAARMSDHVLAVEPFFYDELYENIALNHSNIKVLESAFGNGNIQPVNHMTGIDNMQTMTFKNILEASGGCDFLKCDIEGAEQYLKPEDLKGIRRIEMEIHWFKFVNKKELNKLVKWLKKNYEYVIDYNAPETVMFHGKIKTGGS